MTSNVIEEIGYDPLDYIIRAIPELLALGDTRLNFPFNPPGWYISAMLIAMLPMCYMLIRNRDFYIYVFSPIAAILLFAFLFHIRQDMAYEIRIEWGEGAKFFINLFRAVCGISFGAVAWLIYDRLCKIPDKKRYRLIVTALEIIFNVLFFYTWLFRYSTPATLFCAMLLIPALTAAAFSGKSLASGLFKHNIFRHCGSLSLTIYLNHWIPVMISFVIVKQNPVLGIVLVFILTAVFSLINMLSVRVIKFLWRKLVTVD